MEEEASAQMRLKISRLEDENDSLTQQVNKFMQKRC